MLPHVKLLANYSSDIYGAEKFDECPLNWVIEYCLHTIWTWTKMVKYLGIEVNGIRTIGTFRIVYHECLLLWA